MLALILTLALTLALSHFPIPSLALPLPHMLHVQDLIANPRKLQRNHKLVLKMCGLFILK